MRQHLENLRTQAVEAWKANYRLALVSLVGAGAGLFSVFVPGLLWIALALTVGLILTDQLRLAAPPTFAIGATGVVGLVAGIVDSDLGTDRRLLVAMVVIVAVVLLRGYIPVLFLMVGALGALAATLGLIGLASIPGMGGILAWIVIIAVSIAVISWGMRSGESVQTLDDARDKARTAVRSYLERQMSGVILAALMSAGLLYWALVYQPWGLRRQQIDLGEYVYPDQAVYGLLLIGVALVFLFMVHSQADPEEPEEPEESGAPQPVADPKELAGNPEELGKRLFHGYHRWGHLLLTADRTRFNKNQLRRPASDSGIAIDTLASAAVFQAFMAEGKRFVIETLQNAERVKDIRRKDGRQFARNKLKQVMDRPALVDEFGVNPDDLDEPATT